MRSLLLFLAELLGLVRQGVVGRNQTRTDALLRPLVLLVIVLLAGPDLFAAVEMTTLLDLLGATLFVIAFGVGFKILGVAVLDCLRALLVPPEFSMLQGVRSNPLRAIAVLFLARRALFVALSGLLFYVGMSQLLQLFSGHLPGA
jgi:hypothetical protein